MLFRSELMAIPASKRVLGSLKNLPAKRKLIMTASKAPMNAKSGNKLEISELELVKAIVAPRPAPAAAPSKYGSASGLRNTV